MIACSVENEVPLGLHRNWINKIDRGVFPDVSSVFLPENCQHCANPPCERVCPTGATYRREDGLVLIDYDKCIGCKYCMMACPYDARYVNEEKAAVDKCTSGPPADPAFAAGLRRNVRRQLPPLRQPQRPNSEVSNCWLLHDVYRLYEEPAPNRRSITSAVKKRR
jgi:Fe-S-cluster-containing hydrogenase component 2